VGNESNLNPKEPSTPRVRDIFGDARRPESEAKDVTDKTKIRRSPARRRRQSPAAPWPSRLKRSGRLVWGAITGLGVLTLVAGTVYALKVQPWVTDRLVGNSRLQVQVISQPDFVPLGLVHSGIYLFPQGATTPTDVPAEVGSRQRMTDYERWAQQSGGVPAQTLAMRMTVRAVGDTPVVLNGLRVEVVRRSAPLTGWFRVPEAGCGVQPVRSIRVNLDEDPVRPMLTEVDEATLEEQTRPFDLTLRVTPSDPEVFEIHASTLKSDVEFRMTLLYQSESSSGEFPVEGGRIYRVTALQPGRAEAYDTPFTDDGSASSQALVRAKDNDPGPGGLGFC
jgi:hypothetical protein